ncbi:MAG: alpha/beta fold hydrolase [Nitrospirota bacterium]
MPLKRVRSLLWIALWAVIVGTSVFTYIVYQRDIAPARNRASIGSHIVFTRCGLIEYASVGDGQPILIVHGAGGGFDQGLSFADPFVAVGYRVITMSRFGYLRTPLPPDASPQAQADAHACLLDTLGIERVAGIIGVSAGAPSSMQFSLRYPDRTDRLILLVPLAYAPRSPEQATAPSSTPIVFETALKSDFLFWLAAKIMPRTLVKAILATPPEVFDRASAAERARARSIIDHILPVSSRQQGLLNDAAIASAIARYDLDNLTTPTLAISFADDLYGTYEGARYTAEHVREARFMGYPSGGHVWIGRQDDVLSEIVIFLK